MEIDEELYPGVSPEAWVFVGQLAETYDWDDAFSEIDAAHGCLMDLENLREPVDWESLLCDLPLLSQLGTDLFGNPPLLDFHEFEILSNHFLVVDVSDDPDYRCENLYLSRDQNEEVQELRRQFAELARRLKDYPPLREVMRY